ncbi:MAG: hypothetical protein JJU33_12050 [Phycisphaerales bacterium]|nr:hypothetical protein [Phycisphaerales bacterium]
MGNKRDERQDGDRKRSRAWLKAAVVCLVLFVAVVGVFLAMVQASRGPKGEGVWEIVERLLDERWSDRMDELDDGEAASARYAEAKKLASDAATLVELVYTEPAGFTGPSRLELARPMWGAGDGSRLAPLPQYYPSEAALRDGAARSLAMSRERGMLETIREVSGFEGALLDPRPDTTPGLVQSAEAWALSLLLSLEFVEAIERGDEIGAIEAFDAMQRWAAVLVRSGDWNEHAATAFTAACARLVFDTVELGLMTESLAAGLLGAIAPIDAAASRVRLLESAAGNEIIVLAAGVDWGEQGDSVYGSDGRVNYYAAAESVFRPFETSLYSVVEITSPGIGQRHATLTEIAEYFRFRADQSEEAFRPQRHAREPDADDRWTPLVRDGVVFPSGLELSWFTPQLGRRSLDELELMLRSLEAVLAIEVYRARKGEPPDALRDLVPGVLASVPVNPWNNAGAFGYRVDGDSPYGYRLWIPAEYDPSSSYKRPVGPGHMVYSDGGFLIVPRATR